MVEDGVKGVGFEETLEPKDIAGILAERLPVAYHTTIDIFTDQRDL